MLLLHPEMRQHLLVQEPPSAYAWASLQARQPPCDQRLLNMVAEQNYPFYGYLIFYLDITTSFHGYNDSSTPRRAGSPFYPRRRDEARAEPSRSLS